MLADSHHPVFKKLVSCHGVYSLHKHSAATLASILKQLEDLFKIKMNNWKALQQPWTLTLLTI